MPFPSGGFAITPLLLARGMDDSQTEAEMGASGIQEINEVEASLGFPYSEDTPSIIILCLQNQLLGNSKINH